MKIIAAALVLLSGAITCAGGAVAEGIMTAAQRSSYSAHGNIGMFAGALLVLAGLVLLAATWNSDRAQR
jgi:hypothetical protein